MKRESEVKEKDALKCYEMLLCVESVGTCGQSVDLRWGIAFCYRSVYNHLKLTFGLNLIC